MHDEVGNIQRESRRSFRYAILNTCIHLNTSKNYLSPLFIFLRDVKKQTSKDVELKQGKIYLMTGFLKEHGGGDHLSIGVKYPGGNVEKPISGINLYISKKRWSLLVASLDKVYHPCRLV